MSRRIAPSGRRAVTGRCSPVGTTPPARVNATPAQVIRPSQKVMLLKARTVAISTADKPQIE